MTSQTAYDRYNARYDDAVYLNAVRHMDVLDAIRIQDTALMLCECPASHLANWVRDNATDNPCTAFLALFV